MMLAALTMLAAAAAVPAAAQLPTSFCLPNYSSFSNAAPRWPLKTYDAFIAGNTNCQKSPTAASRTCAPLPGNAVGCNYYVDANSTFVCLTGGNHFEMGRQYGIILFSQLANTLDIICNVYVGQYNYTEEKMLELATWWNYRYSSRYEDFIRGIAFGAGITLTQAKVLNGMVLYGVSIYWNDCPGAPAGHPGTENYNEGLTGSCAFAFNPPSKSAGGRRDLPTPPGAWGYALRNFDFPPAFFDISKYLVTTVLVEPNQIPVAFTSFAGQIYCQTCINAEEIFLELNNAGPSCGFCINPFRQGMLASMLEYMQNSRWFAQLERQLQSHRTDVGLIINAAWAQESKSFEHCPYIGDGNQTLIAEDGLPLVSTNFVQSQGWCNSKYKNAGRKGKCQKKFGKPGMPLKANDSTAWQGFTRRDNIQTLLGGAGVKKNLGELKTLWTQDIDATVDPGAVWLHTVYQNIYDFDTGVLHIRQVKHRSGDGWLEPLNLRAIFASVPDIYWIPSWLLDPNWNTTFPRATVFHPVGATDEI